MPFYDLKCTKCGEEFNVMAKMSDREQNLIECAKCGNKQLDTVFKSVNIVHTRKSEGAACPNIHKCGGCCNH